MTRIPVVIAALMLARSAFSQSEIVFDNNVNASGTPGEFPGAVRSPLYSYSQSFPFGRISGNTATGVPMGSTIYNGALLNGTGFTATLWELNSANVVGFADQNNLNLIATSTMRTSTSSANAGRVAQPAGGNPIVPDVRPGTTDRATFQVRVWDNRGGTILTWSDALAAYEQGCTAIGYSDLFTVPWALTGPGSGTASNLEGLRSFNVVAPLSICVPEPSVVAFGIFGAGCLFCLCRRRAE